MATIVSAVDLWIPLSVSPEARMGDKWAKVLQTLAEDINERRVAKIPNESAFQNKLAEPAAQAWPGVPTGYRSKHGATTEDIRLAYQQNLRRAYTHWKKKLDQAFATVDGIPAKRFKDQVTLGKELWSEIVGEKGLRLTGDRIRNVGAATIATYWLIGEPMAAGMLRLQDTLITGAPYRICPAEFTQSLQVALMQRLVQAGVFIFNSQLDATIISRENTTNNNLVQRYVDPALGIDPFVPGGVSHLDFVKQGALLKLSLQVSRV